MDNQDRIIFRYGTPLFSYCDSDCAGANGCHGLVECADCGGLFCPARLVDGICDECAEKKEADNG